MKRAGCNARGLAAGAIFALAAGIAPARPLAYEDLIGIVDLQAPGAFSVPLAVSPDQRFVAVEARQASLRHNRTVGRWWIVPLAGKTPPYAAGDSGEPIGAYIQQGLPIGWYPPQVPQWSPDSAWIVYRLARGGRIQLWRSRQDGALQEQLTHNALDVNSFRWSSVGKRLFFEVEPSRAQMRAALRLEAAHGYLYDERFAPLYERRPLIDAAALSAHQELWVCEFAACVERRATAQERAEYARTAEVPAQTHPEVKGMTIAARASTRVWLEDRRANTAIGVNQPLTLVASTRGEGPAEWVCEAPSCRGYFRGLWLEPSGHMAYFWRRLDDRIPEPRGLYAWRIGTEVPREILRTRDLFEGCALAGEDQLICGRESVTNPMTLVSIDLRTGSRTTLFDLNPEFHALKFGAVTALTWRAADGTEGFGHLVKPVGYQPGKRYPLVIVQYRSAGFLRGGVGDEYPIHVLAALGFAVLSFEHPDTWQEDAAAASAEEANAMSNIGHRYRHRMLSTLLAGIDLLDRMGVVDPRRVGITGLSAGAELASFALIHAPERFAAAAVANTFWNPINYHLAGPMLQPIWREQGFGDPQDARNAPQWQGMSVALNAPRIRTPLLIQVGDSELLPETQTFTALRRAGKPVEMYVFENEAHVKSQPLHRYHVYKRSVQWLDFWLRHAESPDPADFRQHERWYGLRAGK